MTSSGYLFLPKDVQAFKYHDGLKKAAGLFAGLGHMQPLLLATTNSHYLLDRFCMERCCSSEYISRIVTSLIFMEILSIIVVRIVLYFTLRDSAIWGKWQGTGAKGDTLNDHNKKEELARGIVGSIILILILVGYIQIFYAFTTGGKKGHMHWFYASLLIQHFLNPLIAGSIGFWEVGLALWYLVTLPMAPIVIFFYQLIIHSWIRNNGPRDAEYIIVKWQIWLVTAISIIATILWIMAYTNSYIPVEVDIQSWTGYRKCSPTPGFDIYSVRDDGSQKDIWAGGRCLYGSYLNQSSNKYLYLEIASGGTVQKKFYGRDTEWKVITDSTKAKEIDLYVNGVLGMTISNNTGVPKWRVSIRDEATTTYVHEPQLGRYRAYKHSESGRLFNIDEFINSGPYGSEILKIVPDPPASGIKEVIVYCSLDYNTPLLIYYGDGQPSGQTHNWFKNTGNARWTTAAGTLTAGVEPPTTSPTQTGTQNAQAVRKVLEETNCLVNGVVQINVQQTDGPTYCQGTCNPPRIKVTSDKAGENPYKSLLKGLGGYKVFEHTPNGTSTLTISAFKKGDKYLKGIPTGGTNSYITGVTRVVVFLRQSGNVPLLIYYHTGGRNHHWYKNNGNTAGWTVATDDANGQLQNKSPEQVARDDGSLQSILQDISIAAGNSPGTGYPDSQVTHVSTPPDLTEGAPTDQYNRVYHNILNSYVWLPLLMQGLSVGAVGSIFPNLIPKTLTCPKTTRNLSVVNMFLVTLPHIFNVMLGDNDVNPASNPWTDDSGKPNGWPLSLLLYIFYILAILFAIFNIHYPEWRLSSFLRNNTWMVFLMILFTDVLNESFNAISRADLDVTVDFQLVSPFETEGDGEAQAEMTDFSVTVEKKSGHGITFFCSTLQNDEKFRYIICNVRLFADAEAKNSVSSYNGPEFEDLDDTLQASLDEWLSSLGIDSELCDFIDACSIDKEQREYMVWLKGLESFLA